MIRNLITYDWFTILSLVCLLSIALAKVFYAMRFNDFIMVVGNSKYLKIYSRDLKFFDSFDAFLFVNLSISLSVFIYLAYSSLVGPVEFNLLIFLKLLLLVSTILIIKVLIERLVGSLFEIDGLIDSYLFQKTTFKNYCGLLILAFNLILVYGNIISKSLILVMICTIIVLLIIGFIASYKNHQKLLNLNFFYFLLYLCALEIGPYILAYKVIRDYNP